jgi:hypothetical protein
MKRLLCATIALLLASSLEAQDPASRAETLFDRLREQALPLIEDLHREERFTRRRQLAAEPLAGLADPASATTVDKLAAAVSTDIEGVVAGVSFSPALLVNDNAKPILARFNVVVASLEEGVTRLGAKWILIEHFNAESRKTKPKCALDLKMVDADLRALQDSYLKVCKLVRKVHATDLPETFNPNVFETALGACGIDVAATPNGFPQARAVLVLVHEALNEAWKKNPSDADEHAGEIRQALVETKEAYQALKNYRLPIGTECYKDEDIKAYWKRVQWETPRIRFGVRSQGDFFPKASGFNPSVTDPPAPLSDGRAKKLLVSADVSWERYGVALQGGIGYARERAELTDTLYRAWTPSFSASFMAFSLGGGGLTERVGAEKRRQLRLLKDGSVPPHVAMGLSADGSYARTKPTTQVSKWNSYRLQAFADFKVSDKLSFRVAIPFEATLVKREEVKNKDGQITIPELRNLQKTWPVSVATVIKP